MAAESAMPKGTKYWIETGDKVPQLASFDKAMKEFMQARSIPGGSLAITCGQKLVFARGYTGLVDGFVVQPDSLFRIASVSKPITAVAVLSLVQAGKLAMDDKMVDILPKSFIGDEFADMRVRDITIRHLLQHLGGWDRDKTFDPMFRDFDIVKALKVKLPISKQQIAAYMADKPLQYDPGSTYCYSNYGYMLLGEIIEAVSGVSYQEYVTTAVMKPLGISRATLGKTLLKDRRDDEVKYYSDNEYFPVFDIGKVKVAFPYGVFNIENMAAHGGWLASAVDMVRFAAAFDTPDSCPILSKQEIDIMFGLPENIDAETYKPGDNYYGCGWSIRDFGEGKINTWHTGSLPGTHSTLVRRWKDNLTWCALFNQRDDASGLSYDDIDGMLHRAANEVKWAE